MSNRQSVLVIYRLSTQWNDKSRRESSNSQSCGFCAFKLDNNFTVIRIMSQTAVCTGVKQVDKGGQVTKDHKIGLEDPVLIKPTSKRYIILLLFNINSANKSYQWIQISASSTKLAYYYQVDDFVINATSVIFLASLLFFSLPACALIKSMGLRKAILLGSAGTALGSIVKCFGLVDRLGISMLFIGQILVSISEQFVFSMPNRLVSVWYPDHQLSSAMSIGIIGSQLGVAFGFIISRWFLQDAQTAQEIGQGLDMMFVGTAVFSIVTLIADYLVFDEAPEHPPGVARLKQIEEEYRQSTCKKRLGQSVWIETRSELLVTASQLKCLIANKSMMIVNVNFGISMAIMYTTHTLLDQAIQPYWPNDDMLVGLSGVLLVLVGSLSLPVCGYLLDTCHRYLLATKLLTLASGVAVLAFNYYIAQGHSRLLVYVCAGLVGVFQSCLETASLELSIELTYPASELVTSSFMNLSPQVVGIPLCFISSYIVDNHGAFALGLFFFGASVFAWAILFGVRETLRRQLAAQEKCEPNVSCPGYLDSHSIQVGAVEKQSQKQ